MITLAAGDAYRLWAPTYNEETAISLIEKELAAALSPPLAGKRLLDAGCGTGRRLAEHPTELAIGVDRSPEMLMAGGACCVAVSDTRALPFPAASFDVVWCRLVLGHLQDTVPAYSELARVCRPGGKLLVSDFHAEAVAAGHVRSFRDSSGRVCAVEHYVHNRDAHIGTARKAGFAANEFREGKIGARVEYLYARAGREAQYEKDIGLPVVAAFLFERLANAPAH